MYSGESEESKIESNHSDTLKTKIKHKYTIDFIMGNFSKEKLSYLQSQFKKFCKLTGEEGYPLVEFIQLILGAIPHKPDETYDLIYGVYSLFREIDINGDGTMEWDEFV